MLESALITLCALVCFQPNIGRHRSLACLTFRRRFSCLAVRDTKQIRAEIITALAVADRLYSEVEENIPDPSPLSTNRKEIETILMQVSLIIRAVRSRVCNRCRSFPIFKRRPWNYWVTYIKANTPLKVMFSSARRFFSSVDKL